MSSHHKDKDPAFSTFSAQKIGYRLNRQIGRGFFSTVYLADHILTKKKVAIKVLNKKKLKELNVAEKVWREIEIHRQLNHKHIIQMYDAINTPTDILVILEFAQGGELFEYLVSAGKLSEEESRKIFQQLIGALEYCHNKGIAHRDLKPENILMDEDGNIKLADFGLSNLMQDGTFLRTSCGSPNYAAPEIFADLRYSGSEVDVWSSGVILFALLCGSLPFDEENIPELVKKIKKANYRMPHFVAPDAQNLITRILKVNPLERITIGEIKKHPFFLKDLPPPYIADPDFGMDDTQDSIDMDIVDKIVQFNFKKERVMEALLQNARMNKADPLGSSQKIDDFSDLRIIQVTYKILLQGKKGDKKPKKVFRFFEELDDDEKSAPKSAPKLLTRKSSLHPESGETLVEYFKNHPARKYCLGITIPAIQGLDAAHFMVMILTGIQTLKNVTWNLSSVPKEEFKVELEIIHHSGSGGGGAKPQDMSPRFRPVTAILQLYQSYREHFFLVDLHCTSGDPFLFMTAANQVERAIRTQIKTAKF